MSFLHRGGETEVGPVLSLLKTYFWLLFAPAFSLFRRDRGSEKRERGKKSLNHFVSFDFDEFLADLPLH